MKSMNEKKAALAKLQAAIAKTREPGYKPPPFRPRVPTFEETLVRDASDFGRWLGGL